MLDLNPEYYVLYPEMAPNYPMLSSTLRPRSLGRMIVGDYTLKIQVSEPAPSAPEFVDYHTWGGDPVVSEKFVDALSALNISGVQALAGNEGDVIVDFGLNYYLFHIYNLIESLNFRKSNFQYDDEIEAVTALESFELDSEKLSRIPLRDRMVFRMEEYPRLNIFHESIVDAVEQEGLKGMRFIPVKKWSDNSYFD